MAAAPALSDAEAVTLALLATGGGWSENVTLPSEPDAAHKKIAADLQKLSGAAFDKEYVKNAGVADHAKVHASLKADIAGAKDADVKALASKLEPIVAHHGDMAKKLNASLK